MSTFIVHSEREREIQGHMGKGGREIERWRERERGGIEKGIRGEI